MLAATEEMEAEQTAKYKALKNKGSPLERLRAHTMAKGIDSVRTIQRTFREMDKNEDNHLQYSEFREGLLATEGLYMEEDMLAACFKEMDKSRDGVLDLDEFMVALMPPMSEKRRGIIVKAFEILDFNKNGVLTVDELAPIIDPAAHPKYRSGDWTAEQVFEQRLRDVKGGEGPVTVEDLINYYRVQSAYTESDEHFEKMLDVSQGLIRGRYAQ